METKTTINGNRSLGSRNTILYVFLFLFSFAGSISLFSQTLKLFTSITGRTASDQYKAKVRQAGGTWTEVFVVQTKCKNNPSENTPPTGVDNGYFGNLDGWSASYIAFEFDGMSVEVEIEKIGGSISATKVRPEGETGSVTYANGKAYLTISSPTNVNVDINNQMEGQYTGQGYNGADIHTFTIFANPVYNEPTAGTVVTLQPGQSIRDINGAWDAVIFDKGVHDIGTAYEIKTNKILYIRGDAIVHGTIHPTNAWGNDATNNWKVYGSGTLSGENLTWYTDTCKANKVFTYQAEGVRLEGFVVLDPANHTFNLYNSGETLNIYKNLKIFGWRKNADGINAFKDSEVSDCFLRTQDDDFYLGNNVKIHDNTVWNDANGSVLYLTNSDADSYFKDIKVIYHRAKWHYWGGGRVISMRDLTPGNTSIVDALIQNVLVEDPYPAFGPFYGSMNSGTGDINLSNIVFDNVRQAAPCVGTYDANRDVQPFNALKGLDATRQFKNITFKNCYYNGTYLSSFSSDPNFITSNVNYSSIVFNLTSGIDPYSQIEAENYSSMSGVQAETCSEGGQNLGWIENGDYIVYNNVNFGTGAASFQARVASGGTGGAIEIRLGSITGTLVGTCNVTNTGGWQTWSTVSCTVSGATGTQNLYLKFTGSTGYLFNLNWVKFIAGNTINAFSQIEAESYSSMSGIAAESCSEGGQNIGWVENGDYIVFNNVNFGSGASSFQARVASTASGSIEIRLGSITGTLVGTCNVTSTGGWQTWSTVSCSVSGATGTQNLYLKFTGGTGFLFNLNWVKFLAGSIQNIAELTSWVSGTTNNKVNGTERLMVVMVMGEHSADFSATAVTYGGQTMTKQSEKMHTDGSRTYSAIFTLKESGVYAANSGNIAVTWSVTPSGSNVYSVLLDNVDQTTPVSATANNSVTGTTLSTSALSNASGDWVIMCGATATNNTITFNNSFTNRFETNSSWGDGIGGSKVCTGSSETPSFTQSASGRMTLCGIVVKRSSTLKSNTVAESIDKNSKSSDQEAFAYPNPVSSTLNINHAEGASIRILNIQGQLIYNKNTSGKQTRIDVTNINANGMVFVQVISGSKTNVFKIKIDK